FKLLAGRGGSAGHRTLHSHFQRSARRDGDLSRRSAAKPAMAAALIEWKLLRILIRRLHAGWRLGAAGAEQQRQSCDQDFRQRISFHFHYPLIIQSKTILQRNNSAL